MFQNLFNYDNPVWRFIGKFGDLILLNLLWIVCSIPIFTIGASTTAVYYVTLKLVRNEDGYTIRSFFKSFKDNFKQATIIWLIMLAVGLILGIDLWVFTKGNLFSAKVSTVMTVVFMAMAIVYAAVFTFIFPLQARFYNPVKRTFLNAFFMSISHLFSTLGMVIMDVGVVVISFLIPQISMFLVLFGFPLIAFLNSYLLAPVFDRYIPKEEERDEELRPLFADEDK